MQKPCLANYIKGQGREDTIRELLRVDHHLSSPHPFVVFYDMHENKDNWFIHSMSQISKESTREQHMTLDLKESKSVYI